MSEPLPLSLANEPGAAWPRALEADGLIQRRLVVFALNIATYGALCTAMAIVAGSGGWTLVDALLFLCYALATPWTVLGFWNAVLGIWLLHGRRDELAARASFFSAEALAEPIHLRTAVLTTLRNEAPRGRSRGSER